MILDELLEFADAASVAAAEGTALIGDVVDLGAVPRDIGAPGGDQLWWVITIDTEVITGGAAGTIEFKLVSDAQAAIATDGSATVHATSGALVTDDAAANSNLLNAGAMAVCIPLPAEGNVYERYLGVICIIVTTTVTAGKINSFLTRTPPKWRAYPNNVQ